MAKADLTEQIVFEILLRLPVKTLSVCKAVCKSWSSLISSSYFVKTHISISTNDPHSTGHHLLSVYSSAGYEFENHSVYSLLNEDVTEAIKIDNPFKKDCPDFVGVVGCCNGLVCLISDEPMHVFLWNPSTRKIRRLPKLIDTYSVFPLRCFCYDESTDDFKLFVIDGCLYEQKVSVYSSKSDCWKLIGDFPFGLALENGGVLADGAVHWVATKPNTQSNIIVSFDIKKETFGEFDLPADLMDNWIWRTLDTFGKSLSVVNCMTHDIWVLKERGVKESWTKVFTIPTDILQPIGRVNPLCICVNGDILVNLDTTIRLYNSEDNTGKVLLHENYKAIYTYAYVESLVSP